MNEEKSLIVMFDEASAEVARETAPVVHVRVPPRRVVDRCDRIATFFQPVLWGPRARMVTPSPPELLAYCC